MFTDHFQIIPAQTSDTNLVSDFINTSPYYFRHLDWRLPINWLGCQPFLLAEYNGSLNALMACPYLNQHQVWMRCFAGKALNSAGMAWELMLERVKCELQAVDVQSIYSISLQPWYTDLLRIAGFTDDNQVVVLEKHLIGNEPIPEPIAGYILNRMQPMELEEVWELDRRCFEPLWQMSHEDILTAFHVSDNCAVIRTEDGTLVGYQISNTMPTGGHLARIAILPEYQGHGLGRYLLADLTKKFITSGTARITVNTQLTNCTAINLYEKNGFVRNGEIYPVYRLDL
jgi:[ribosomal protein S18]-alanine N-acetyltransferase